MAYESVLEEMLSSYGLRLSDSARIAESVLRLSDFYIANPKSKTPWHEKFAQIAMLAYYFPLNYLRATAVSREAKRLGFLAGIEQVVDYGAGVGTALLALNDETERRGGLAIDFSETALQMGRKLGGNSYVTSAEFNPATLTDQSLLLASYVLTEFSEPPDFFLTSEALMLIEPATQDDGRRLLEFRARLIDAGFFIWAPCTHQLACPLLTASDKDWCHDRIHFAQPEWFSTIETHLPMKNKTLAFSYLLARRSLQPPAELNKLLRFTGDQRDEKGKSRIAVCRGSEREFMAWFPKRMACGEELEFSRGNLARLRFTEKVANELRINSADQIEELVSTASL